MLNVLIATRFRSDRSQDLKQTPLVLVVQYLVKDGIINLVILIIVILEFRQNRKGFTPHGRYCL